MLDIIGLVYFGISSLYLLGRFPIHIFEFLDLRQGYALSDYATLFETGTYFNISAIITGLLCGLDAITFPLYQKVNSKLYNLHALVSFSLLGIGFFPVSLENQVIHWFFALLFVLVYPATRLLILRKFDKVAYRKLLIFFLVTNLLVILVYAGSQFKLVLYPEYVMGANLFTVIIVSKLAISKKHKK